ncbi:MAG: hypothetical protein WBA10_20425 [Elainellaceae cyanobacterium]
MASRVWFWRACRVAITGITVGMAIAPPTQAADRIVEIRNGAATIDQDNGQVWSARTGTLLRIGDLLRPAPGAVVVVRCSNGTVREVRYVAGVGAVCPDSVRDRTSATGRGEDDFLAFLLGSFVYGTQVMEATPLLRWEAVDGAMAYRVQVVDGEQVLWDATAQATQVSYGGEPLAEGSSYQVIISALRGDDVLSRSRLVLRRLAQAEAAAVEAQVTALQDEALSEEGQAIALAQLYLDVAEPLTDPPEGAGLVLKAIAALEEAIAAGVVSPFTHRLLGDLYLRVGLLGEAVAQYERVIELTWQEDDVLSRAAAWVGLANVAAARGEAAIAREHLEFARINYRVRGDGARVAQIEGWLEKLE